MPVGPLFKVKLASGRILGPLDLDRVRLLILKNQIVGIETARQYPQGEWVDINQIGPIADMLIARADGKLKKDTPAPVGSGYSPLMGDAGMFSTQVLPGALPVNDNVVELNEIDELETAAAPTQAAPPTIAIEDNDRTVVAGRNADAAAAPSGPGGEKDQDNDHTTVMPSEDDDKTRVAPPEDSKPSLEIDRSVLDKAGLEAVGRALQLEEVNDHTRVETSADSPAESPPEESVGDGIEFSMPDSNMSRIATEKTVVFQRSDLDLSSSKGATGQARVRKPKNKVIEMLKASVVAIGLGLVGYQLLLDDGPTAPGKGPYKWVPIRPQLPAYIKGDSKPEESNRIYAVAMRDYVLDNVAGYKAAADKMLQSAAYDIANVKALAMLASCYLNLIDSSSKDENYFAVIAKLIEMSRAKSVDLPETVIADVEFFIMANKAEAAENRIVEYTKSHPSFGAEMYYYLGLAFFERGDTQMAAKYLGGIPDNKAFSVKVFYLRGLVAEKLNDPESALKEYEKGLLKSPSHAKSRLRIAVLLDKRGSLKEAAAHLDYVVTHPSLLAPKDMALAYFLHAQLSQAYSKLDIALGDMERAVKLDAENHDYLLELYTLRAKAGDTSVKNMQHEARMYFYLSEGEKLMRLNKPHDALIQYLQATQTNPESPLPLVKIGDMFRLQNDIGNAMANYRKASEKAPKSIEVWSKYINTLILSYEWDEARKAMEKFKNLQVQPSAIDKLTADWYEKQGQHAEAQMYYKKAMSRDSVDSEVYIAYAKSLMSTKNFKEAPFFFALALRFDPLNVDAILGTAKCIAATDSIERAIRMLQDELTKGNHPSGEMLSAIGELYIQKGDWDQAQQNVDQAKAADPELAAPWKLQAQIYMNHENTDKEALDHAAAAYQSYSERNPSDPSGYLERYNIYLKKTNFEKASEELSKIFAQFPKYPKLHFYKGWIYSAQGNHKVAAEEYKKELENNPQHVQTMVALGKELMELGYVAGPGGAQELLNKAMQLAPTNPDAKQQAGYAAYLLKNYQAAIALFNAAIVYDHANPQIYKRLGMTYRDMGDHAGAAAAFHKYIEMEPDAPDKNEYQ